MKVVKWSTKWPNGNVFSIHTFLLWPFTVLWRTLQWNFSHKIMLIHPYYQALTLSSNGNDKYFYLWKYLGKTQLLHLMTLIYWIKNQSISVIQGSVHDLFCLIKLLFLVGVSNKRYICCAPSSDLPGLKTGLPHLPTKPWLEDGAPVLRPGCPIFRLQLLPHLLTRLEDGADPTSDLPHLPTMSGWNYFFK